MQEIINRFKTGVFNITCFLLSYYSQFWGRIQNVKEHKVGIWVDLLNNIPITHNNRIKDR